MKIAIPLRSAMGQLMVAALSNGSADSPKLQIRDGSMPASIGSGPLGTLLSEHELTNQVATENNGVITFDAIGEELSVKSSGIAGWARLLDRNGAEVMYLTVSETGAGGELQLNSLNLQEGSSVLITAGVISVGS